MSENLSTIEKGIPIPPLPNFPAILRQMDVGDSVLSPMNHDNTRSSVHRTGKQLGWKFTCRKVARDGIRVWRIA